MTDKTVTMYWELLILCEDFLDSGYLTEHGRASSLSGLQPLKTGGAGTVGNRSAKLEELHKTIRGCTKCGLSKGRNRAVPGEGVTEPVVFVIGEGPGADEDRTGRPFVGKAGRYLDKWLDAIGLSRNTNCFIGNILKCRPPENRDPLPEESSACFPYLQEQVELLQPKVILSLGRISSQILTERVEGITALRGKTYRFMDLPLIPTYHPSGVLRNQEYRSPVWDDLKRLKALLHE